MNISLIGMPGCGKTSVGKEIAVILNMKFIDIDVCIENEFGSIESLFAIGEEHFRQIESKVLKEHLLFENAVISTGGGIILSEENRKLLKKNSVVFFINREINDILATNTFENRPLLNKNNDRIHQLYQQRISKYYETADYIINSNNILNDTINQILISINKKT